MHDLILFVGYRGVGKTTIAKQLAKSLGYHFLDTDEEIVRRRQAEIADIVASEGWDNFRMYEREVLQSLKNCRRTVVATGGGAVAHQQEWQDLHKKGVVVWLTADREILLDRLRQDSLSPSQRPSITGTGLEEEIITLLNQRNPLYQKVSHYCLDTGNKNVDEIVDEVVGVLSGSMARSVE